MAKQVKLPKGTKKKTAPPLPDNPQMWYSKSIEKKVNSEFWDNLGKLLIDMAKLTFASFILGGMLKGGLPQNILIAAGCIVFLIFAVIGLLLTSRKKGRG